MPEITGTHFSKDAQFRKISAFDPNLLKTGVVLYEVLRIYDNIPLFLEDHVARLQESVNLSGFKYTVSLPVIKFLIRDLVRKNQIASGNVKIVLNFIETKDPVLYTFFIPHSYPTQEMYLEGVESDFFTASRKDPNIKKLHAEIADRVSAFIRTENLYDALLVGQNELVTEGSKTNIFFVNGEVVFTAPDDLVLKGITREKIKLLCRKLNYTLIEKPIYIYEMHGFEAAFFSGTSPKVLPIRRIANIHFNISNPIMQSLVYGYDELIRNYITL